MLKIKAVPSCWYPKCAVDGQGVVFVTPYLFDHLQLLGTSCPTSLVTGVGTSHPFKIFPSAEEQALVLVRAFSIHHDHPEHNSTSLRLIHVTRGKDNKLHATSSPTKETGAPDPKEFVAGGVDYQLYDGHIEVRVGGVRYVGGDNYAYYLPSDPSIRIVADISLILQYIVGKAGIEELKAKSKKYRRPKNAAPAPMFSEYMQPPPAPMLAKSYTAHDDDLRPTSFDRIRQRLKEDHHIGGRIDVGLSYVGDDIHLQVSAIRDTAAGPGAWVGKQIFWKDIGLKAMSEDELRQLNADHPALNHTTPIGIVASDGTFTRNTTHADYMKVVKAVINPASGSTPESVRKSIGECATTHGYAATVRVTVVLDRSIAESTEGDRWICAFCQALIGASDEFVEYSD